MAGKKGQKAWNKREEYEWRDIWTLSKTELSSLAQYFARQIKKYKDFETAYSTDDNFRKLYNKWLEISTTVFVKGIPQKIEGSGDKGELKVIVEIADENNPAQKSGNRISQYLQI
jgi:hypothetical protein